MHPLRKLREAGKPTLAQISELLAEDIVFNSPILARPIQGRELVAPIFTQSSATRGSGTYTAEFSVALFPQVGHHARNEHAFLAGPSSFRF